MSKKAKINANNKINGTILILRKEGMHISLLRFFITRRIAEPESTRRYLAPDSNSVLKTPNILFSNIFNNVMYINKHQQTDSLTDDT
ncbi:hypothetical protein ACSZNV_15295 [Aeromonas hydrophila]|uniref:hypothetical protein n=1 Tax=Aeromonas hydrophila TaxID=644 RepID=UPI001CC788D0|nr:hypothetical protein [Aeromonas hydrophila]